MFKTFEAEIVDEHFEGTSNLSWAASNLVLTSIRFQIASVSTDIFALKPATRWKSAGFAALLAFGNDSLIHSSSRYTLIISF